MLAALGYGLLASSSLVLGAGFALVRPWPTRAVGLVSCLEPVPAPRARPAARGAPLEGIRHGSGVPE